MTLHRVIIAGQPCADVEYIGKLRPITTPIKVASGPEMDKLAEHFASLSPERRAALENEWEAHNAA